jgi:hypothetical protein
MRPKTAAHLGPTVLSLERGWSVQTPTLVTTFGERALVGVSGSIREEPLETLKLSIVDRIADTSNGAFLRDDALLAFVILTDEDVAGLPSKSVDQYIADLDAVKGGARTRWASAIIAGPTPTPSMCNAQPANKLTDFTRKVGPTGVISSICDPDLAGGLDRAVRTFSAACKTFNLPR